MAVFVGYEPIVFLAVLCLASLVHAQDTTTQNIEYSTATTERADDSTEVTTRKHRFGFDTGASARTETTPAVCSDGVPCEFHHYRDFDSRNDIYKITKYCNCPEGERCVLDRDHMEQKVFKHKCKPTTASATEAMSTNRGETEQGSETPLSTGTEGTETPETADPTITEMDATLTPTTMSGNVRSLRELQDRVGEVTEHVEL